MKVGFDFDGVIGHTPLTTAAAALASPVTPAHRYVARYSKPDPAIRMVVDRLAADGHSVTVVTGRPDSIQEETEAWLRENGLPDLADNLYTNPKRELTMEGNAHHKVRLIKRLGLTVFVDDNPAIVEILRRETDATAIQHHGDWNVTYPKIERALGRENPSIESLVGPGPTVDTWARHWNEEAFLLSGPAPRNITPVIYCGPYRTLGWGGGGVKTLRDEYAVADDVGGGRTLLMSRMVEKEGGVAVDWGPVGEYDGENLGILLAHRGRGAGTAFVKELIRRGELRPSIGYSPEGLATVRRAYREIVGVENPKPFVGDIPAGMVETGKPMTFHYGHNTESSPVVGTEWAQDIEPAGYYIVATSPTWEVPGWVYGDMTFESPIVLEMKTPRHGGWKTDLSNMFGGKKGRALSAAIRKAGHDGVVTVDGDHVSEMVALEMRNPGACPLSKYNFGGIPDVGGYSSLSTYEVGAGRIAEAAHCILGSLGKVVIREKDMKYAMDSTERGHISEEMYIIVDSLEEYGRQLYIDEFFEGPEDYKERKYWEKVMERRAGSIPSILEVSGTLEKRAREMREALPPWQEYDGVQRAVYRMAMQAYTVLIRLAQAMTRSVRGYPQRIYNGLHDTRLNAAVDALRATIGEYYGEDPVEWYREGRRVKWGMNPAERGDFVPLCTAALTAYQFGRREQGDAAFYEAANIYKYLFTSADRKDPDIKDLWMRVVDARGTRNPSDRRWFTHSTHHGHDKWDHPRPRYKGVYKDTVFGKRDDWHIISVVVEPAVGDLPTTRAYLFKALHTGEELVVRSPATTPFEVGTRDHPAPIIEELNREILEHERGVCYRRRPVNPRRNPAVVTVPHALGTPEYPTFDATAERAADRVVHHLGPGDLHYHVGDVPRDRIDLNRPESREVTEFRQALHGVLAGEPNDTYLIDVHSFPADDHEWGDHDIVLVLPGRSRQWYEDMLHDELTREGLRVLTASRRAMDIVPEAREVGVPVAFLIEFNDGLSKAKRDLAAKTVVGVVQRIRANRKSLQTTH